MLSKMESYSKLNIALSAGCAIMAMIYYYLDNLPKIVIWLFLALFFRINDVRYEVRDELKRTKQKSTNVK